jgi:quinol-cytochrome oxidoreductase complex cytochrome b subunit
VTALQLAVEVAGWSGAALILLAYLLLSAERLSGQSLVYQGMNVVGALGFVINGWWHGAIPSAALNVLWLLIGGVASWRIIQKRRSSTSAM